jgi:hypothetical protein
VANEASLFRAQLWREDIARLHRLQQLAWDCTDVAAFTKAGMRIGWTQGDARTQELREPLERLLALVYRSERGVGDDDLDRELEAAWLALHQCRMERLVGCLSTPVPKPDS